MNAAYKDETAYVVADEKMTKKNINNNCEEKDEQEKCMVDGDEKSLSVEQEFDRMMRENFQDTNITRICNQLPVNFMDHLFTADAEVAVLEETKSIKGMDTPPKNRSNRKLLANRRSSGVGGREIACARGGSAVAEAVRARRAAGGRRWQCAVCGYSGIGLAGTAQHLRSRHAVKSKQMAARLLGIL